MNIKEKWDITSVDDHKNFFNDLLKDYGFYKNGVYCY